MYYDAWYLFYIMRMCKNGINNMDTLARETFLKVGIGLHLCGFTINLEVVSCDILCMHLKKKILHIH